MPLTLSALDVPRWPKEDATAEPAHGLDAPAKLAPKPYTNPAPEPADIEPASSHRPKGEHHDEATKSAPSALSPNAPSVPNAEPAKSTSSHCPNTPSHAMSPAAMHPEQDPPIPRPIVPDVYALDADELSPEPAKSPIRPPSRPERSDDPHEAHEMAPIPAKSEESKTAETTPSLAPALGSPHTGTQQYAKSPPRARAAPRPARPHSTQTPERTEPSALGSPSQPPAPAPRHGAPDGHESTAHQLATKTPAQDGHEHAAAEDATPEPSELTAPRAPALPEEDATAEPARLEPETTESGTAEDGAETEHAMDPNSSELAVNSVPSAPPDMHAPTELPSIGPHHAATTQPSLSPTPASSTDPTVEASACTFPSHTCSGTTDSFTPPPNSRSTAPRLPKLPPNTHEPEAPSPQAPSPEEGAAPALAPRLALELAAPTTPREPPNGAKSPSL
jgi:hypothetical protein